MKPVVTDEDDVECWEKLKVTAFFGNSGLSRSWCKKSKICQPNFLHRFEAFSSDQDGRYQTISYRELKDKIEIKSFKYHFPKYRTASIPMQRKKLQKSHRESFYKRNLFEALIEEMKRLVMGETGGWLWKSRTNTNIRFHWKNWTIKNLIKRAKYSSAKIMFQIEIWMEGFEFVVVEKNSFEYWAKLI